MTKDPLHVYKAQPIGDQVIPDLVLNITEPFPDCATLTEGAAKHARAANDIAEALFGSLPGGTLHALLVEFLQRKLDHTVIRWDRRSTTGLEVSGEGVPNLDALDDAELSEVGVAAIRLNIFVDNALVARRDRLAGRIDAAIQHETANEQIYSQLPAWARW